MGEAGLSPALSRNCNAGCQQSQITRLKPLLPRDLSRIGGGDARLMCSVRPSWALFV